MQWAGSPCRQINLAPRRRHRGSRPFTCGPMIAEHPMPTIHDVRSYWDSHPLFSYEVTDVGSPLFFQSIDAIKRTDVERFALDYWEFDRFPGRKVLDIGCGPGWLTVQYAHGGADVTAVALTDRAVALARTHWATSGLSA